MRKMIFKSGSKRMTLRLPADIYEWLLKEAEKRDVEISRVIRDCIRHVMEETRNESE